jgi:hypothetical protein
MHIHSFGGVAILTVTSLLAMCALLHLLPRLGKAGARLSAATCRAPVLDWLVSYFTVAPLFVGPLICGWRGFAGAVAGQFAALILWTLAHELAHPAVRRGPRIFKVLHERVGAARNLTAVFITALVTPIFWAVRMAQILLYPFLIWLVRFPAYEQGQWINVSRHKFSGLIGHDRIWCLYCDWMTGVWSLGTEMLRNVESFWCPIRFSSPAKCENCRIDFPDLVGGWVSEEGNIADAARLIADKYPADGEAPYAWFGHPVRLTVAGRSVAHVETAAAQ